MKNFLPPILSKLSILKRLLFLVKKKALSATTSSTTNPISHLSDLNSSLMNGSSIDSTTLESFFNQEASAKRTETTYAKTHYFPHTSHLEGSHPYVLKERFKDNIRPVAAPALLFEAKWHLDSTGILKQTPEGLVYLDISDDYIHKLYPFLQEEGLQKPYYSAHIPVISEQEKSHLEGIQEIGQSFKFSPQKCIRLMLKHHPQLEEIWMLNVKSPPLEHFREKYKLPSKLHSQEFSIVIAVKPKTSSPKEEDNHYYFRINPAISQV
jgi:hypothetical protein